MEKALETIDNAIEILNQTRSMFFADHTVYGGFKKSDFNKAINGLTIISAKIEEAMKPKTCEGCVYGVFGVDSFGLEIECTLAYRCSRGQDDMFKPKDNA